MELFDIVAGKVVIHQDALGIPAFKKVWDADSSDKVHATKVITYVVLKNKHDSPYVMSQRASDIERKLKEQVFGDADYQLTVDELLCEQEYQGLLDTSLLKLLRNMRRKLDAISDYYNDSLGDALDETVIQKLLAGFEKVKGTCITLDYLEKAVKAEQMTVSKVRGDNKVNPYELVK